MIEVLETGSWIFGQNNMSEGGLIGQLTMCRLDGIVFYTRENVNGISSFYISSSERQGDKAGNTPRASRQTLELFAPDIFWESIAQAVKEVDPMKRPVIKNKLFNRKWIDEHFTTFSLA
jgi:hypothetical protein